MPNRRRPLGLASLLLTGAFLAPWPAAATRRPAACAWGRFVVTVGGAAFGDGAGATALLLQASRFAVEGPCPVVGKVGKTRRKGAPLSATWEGCGAVPRLRLRATARDCHEVRGTLRRGKRRTRFVATASRCGDGVVDRGAGEECDGTLGCATGVACAASCRCDGPGPEPLECELAGYPCTWSEVSPDVKDASLARGAEAAALLKDGGTTDDAVRMLAAGPLAEMQHDADLLRFRLPGGRPVWVSRRPAFGPSAGAATAASAVRTASTTGMMPRVVVHAGQVPKHALVLSPFGFYAETRGQAAAVATVLESIPDYRGQVVQRSNDTPESRTVGIEDFAHFAGNDVVFVTTHGAMICVDLDGRPISPCRAFVNTGLVDDPDVGVGVVGVDFHFFPEFSRTALAVGADFFRHAYPNRLDDALIVLNACHGAGSDVGHALEGKNSNYVGWSGPVSPPGSQLARSPFLEALAQGRSIVEVHRSLGEALTDPVLGNHLAIGAQDIRIRELPRVLDAFTGETLTSSGTVQVSGYPGDGEPDSLLLVTEVDGVEEVRAGAFDVTMTVDGVKVGGGVLAAIGTKDGDYRWRIASQVDLGFDVSEGQTIAIRVEVALPEGGTSVFQASPKVTSPGFDPGRVWQGTFTNTFDVPDARIRIIVDATFERTASSGPPSQHPIFEMTQGTMTWSLQNVPSSPDACDQSAPTTVTPLGPDEYSYFTFDLTKQPVEYFGFGSSGGPSVDLTITCPDLGSTVSSTEAGGEWFQAFANHHYTVTGSTFAGLYATGGLYPSTFEWSVHKLE